MGGRAPREKGDRVERGLVALHKDLGVYAERVPLSGATHYRGSGADLDVYVNGREAAPLVCESKSRASGEGFATIERWLQDYDVLFLRRDRKKPLVLLPWSTWSKLLARR